jgi:hypothetical protein
VSLVLRAFVAGVTNGIKLNSIYSNVKKYFSTRILKKFIEGALEGVLYISMGSNLQSSQTSEGKRQAFMEAVSKYSNEFSGSGREILYPGSLKM